MAAITAALVKQLRDRTGQSMMDCKKALTETEGDLEQALDLLRKKGMAVLEKRGAKENNEGRIVARKSPDGKTAVVTSLCCETDFTAKNENFQAAAEVLADTLLAADAVPADGDGFQNLAAADGRKISEVVSDMVSQSGEKTTIGKFARFDLTGPGLIYSYVHFNGKVATMVQIDAESDAVAQSEAAQTLASDLAMHITATNPQAVTSDEIDPELIAKEREIALEQVKGKPENIIENIVKGKINKWFQQVVLLDQPFVKDDKQTVQQVVDATAKQAGGKLTVKRFARLQIG